MVDSIENNEIETKSLLFNLEDIDVNLVPKNIDIKEDNTIEYNVKEIFKDKKIDQQDFKKSIKLMDMNFSFFEEEFRYNLSLLNKKDYHNIKKDIEEYLYFEIWQYWLEYNNIDNILLLYSNIFYKKIILKKENIFIDFKEIGTKVDKERNDYFNNIILQLDWKDNSIDYQWNMSLKKRAENTIFGIENPNIDKEELMIFISKFLAQNTENSIVIKELIKLRLSEYEKTKNSPNRRREEVVVTKLLISSIKSELNKNKINNKDNLHFSEMDIRKKVLWIKLAEFKKIWESNIDWRINNICISINKDVTPTILSFIKENRQNTNFKLTLFYHNKEDLIRNFFWKLKKEDFDRIEKNVTYVYTKDVNIHKWSTLINIRNRDWAILLWDWTILETKSSYQDDLTEQYDNLVPVFWKDIYQSELYFQWWNIRQTEKNIFIGYDDIYATIKKDNINNVWKYIKDDNISSDQIREAIQMFEKEFGKKAIVIWLNKDANWEYVLPKEKQLRALFHIDVFITPIDEKTIIVRDFSEESWSEKETKFTNNVAKQLIQEWFVVHRMKTKWIYTYNNALVENYIDENNNKIKKIYIPKYILSQDFEWDYLWKLNKDAKEFYTNLWFDVVQIEIDNSIIRAQWALNCITFEDRTSNK